LEQYTITVLDEVCAATALADIFWKYTDAVFAAVILAFIIISAKLVEATCAHTKLFIVVFVVVTVVLATLLSTVEEDGEYP
jgi:Na+/H+-translocating membrane pyrophosphatase